MLKADIEAIKKKAADSLAVRDKRINGLTMSCILINNETLLLIQTVLTRFANRKLTTKDMDTTFNELCKISGNVKEMNTTIINIRNTLYLDGLFPESSLDGPIYPGMKK